ncbi:MAG: response regulator [Spirochaetes bacterium]|nr:response regulator [Spirochaetota bacterium]
MNNLFKSILVIDDDQLILKSIKKQLKDENFDVDFIDDPLEGMKMIDNKKYDLILSDIKMKPILGIEVLEKVKKRYPHLPIIIITGYVDDKLMKKAKELGCNDYLIKPIRKNDLINSLNNILNN